MPWSMTARGRRCVGAMLVVGGFVLPTRAQDVAVERPVFEDLVEVSEVFVDVLATDSDGRLVPGLTKDDFVVEEDGRPVELTSVSFYATRYGVAADEEEVPASRYLIFFFHNPWPTEAQGERWIRQQIRVALAARRWVEGEMEPSDWVAVVSYGRGLVVHQDFTQDRLALARALGDAVVGKAPPPTARRTTPEADELGVLRRLPQGRALRAETPNVYEALRLLAESCGYLVGRKNLLLFTRGLEASGRHPSTAAPDPELYPRLEPVLNDHNVAVYPIDLSPAGYGTRQTDLLARLAADTGGVYYEDFVGFRTPLRSIAASSYGYYLLSYQSTHPAGEIGYREIEVRSRREGVNVRTRKGYRYGL